MRRRALLPPPPSAHRALELEAHELVHLRRELERQLVEHVPAEPRYDHPHSLLRVDPPLLEVEELLLANLARARLVLHPAGRLPDLDVRVGGGRRAVSDEHRVALRVVARPGRRRRHGDEPAVGVGRLAGGDALGHDAAPRVLAHVHHLRARVRLLHVVGERHGVELPDAAVPREHARGVFPRDGAPRLHLRPADLAIVPLAQPALRDEVVDAAHALLVPGVPVLHRAVLDLGVLLRHELHHSRVQLVLVVARRRAPLQV
mmetsp:Transcript_11451/g.39820  ORF Transcript_11451/g.39820 Transcript_11451/m.39820 type:complete len:260 (-) Transcript_11451:476-1255(-)